MSQQLRAMLGDSGQTRYEVSKATGIHQSVLGRFAAGASLGGENIDRLCRYLRLELRRIGPDKGGNRRVKGKAARGREAIRLEKGR